MTQYYIGNNFFNLLQCFIDSGQVNLNTGVADLKHNIDAHLTDNFISGLFRTVPINSGLGQQVIEACDYFDLPYTSKDSKYKIGLMCEGELMSFSKKNLRTCNKILNKDLTIEKIKRTSPIENNSEVVWTDFQYLASELYSFVSPEFINPSVGLHGLQTVSRHKKAQKLESCQFISVRTDDTLFKDYNLVYILDADHQNLYRVHNYAQLSVFEFCGHELNKVNLVEEVQDYLQYFVVEDINSRAFREIYE